MAPEQLAGDLDKVGPASDVYSLGATLYCILTGQAPFVGNDLAEVQDRVRRGEFPSPRAVRRDVPPALEAICLKAVRPEDRYPSARSLAADVEKWLADERVSAWREPWPGGMARWARRHRSWVVANAAALGLTAVVGATAALSIARSLKSERAAIVESHANF